MKKLENKVALITGAAQGIGTASALRMASEGATIVVADILEEKARTVVQKIIEDGGKAIFIALDVTKEEAWIAAIAEVRATYGALHILMNNAGIGRASPLVDMDYKMFRQLFAINVDGMFLGMKHTIPLITESGGGSIINLSSIASRKPELNMSAYCATKAAIAHLTKVAALECASAKNNIRVNSMHPGMIVTPAWDALGNLNGDDPSTKLDLVAMAEKAVPLGFAGMPDDIANAVLFLASEDSRYMTGSEMIVDGGQVLL